jgi:hypothetical protein
MPIFSQSAPLPGRRKVTVSVGVLLTRSEPAYQTIGESHRKNAAAAARAPRPAPLKFQSLVAAEMAVRRIRRAIFQQ